MRSLSLLLATSLVCACHPIAPTYSEIESKIFLTGCATSSCHSATGRAGGLDLTAGKGYAALVDVAPQNAKAQALGLKRVVPGDPSKSFLFTKVGHGPLDAEFKAVMPPIGDPLDEDSLWAIETWIREGAKND